MRSNESGFTTIETLQASVLSSIAMVGLFSMLFTTIQGNAQARDLTIATTLAETKMEELRATPFASLTNGLDTVAGGGTQWTRTWAVAPGPTADTKKVVVSIGGVGRGAAPLQIATILAE
jgi:Tfp pilus assembly protein PilV